MNSLRKPFFPALICSSLVSNLHNSVRNNFRHDEKRTGAEYHGSAQLEWIFQRARTENCRVNRPLRTRIAASGDARGPSFPLNLYFLSYAQATPTQSGVFYAAPSHAVQGLPFVSLPLVPPILPPRPLSFFIGVIPSLSLAPLCLRALIVPSRFLTLPSHVFFSPMRACARAYIGCLRTETDSLLYTSLYIVFAYGLVGSLASLYKQLFKYSNSEISRNYFGFLLFGLLAVCPDLIKNYCRPSSDGVCSHKIYRHVSYYCYARTRRRIVN